MGIRDMLQILYEKANVLWKHVNGNINTYNASMNTELLALNAIPSSTESEKFTPERYIARHPNLLYYAREQVRVGRKFAQGGQAAIHAAQLDSKFSIKRRSVVVKKFGTFPGVHQGLFPVEFDTYTNMYVCKPSGFFVENGSLCMIMDRYSGDLRDLIDSQMKSRDNKTIITRQLFLLLDWLCTLWKPALYGPPFTESVAVSIIIQLALALRSLHDSKIYHRDLKCKNILVQRNLKGMLIRSGASDMNFAVALSDFETSDGVAGTGFWRAPEVLQIVKDQNLKHRSIWAIQWDKTGIQWDKADVYSFGMTCYEILSGRSPFDDQNSKGYDVVLSGRRPELPAHVPQVLEDIIQSCWSQEPKNRPTFAEIVSLLKDNYKELWDVGFSKVETVMRWESALKTPPDVFLELERLVVADTAVHKHERHRKNASKFVETVKEFTDLSRFGWSSFDKHPSLPFAEFVERERLYTIMTLQYTEECDIYDDFVHPKDAAFDTRTRIVHLMEKVYFTATDGVWRGRYSGQVHNEGLLLSKKLLIVRKDFVEPLLDAGASKLLIFKMAKRLLHDLSVHQEENERFQLLFMISISLFLVPKFAGCVARLQRIVGSRELQEATWQIYSIPSIRLLLHRVFTENDGTLRQSLNVFLDLLAIDLFLPVITIFLQMELLSWRGLLRWWLADGILRSLCFLTWRLIKRANSESLEGGFI